MTRVALYGGSFDPPTVGHVVAGAQVAARPDVDRLLVVPCYRQSGKTLAPFGERFRLVRQAFAWVPGAEVSDVEERLGGESLTLRTVERLLADHPDWTLRFVVGRDVYDRGPTWGADYWAELCRLAPPLVVGRAGYGPGEVPEPPETSSSDARAARARGDVAAFVRLVPRTIALDAWRLYPGP